VLRSSTVEERRFAVLSVDAPLGTLEIAVTTDPAGQGTPVGVQFRGFEA
jgi:hypothetical protein